MSQPNRATLLGLPAKLRLEIYHHAMLDFTINRPRYSIPEHPLLQANKLIRGEAMSSYNNRLIEIVDEAIQARKCAEMDYVTTEERLGRYISELKPAKKRFAMAWNDCQGIKASVADKRRQLKEDGYELRD